MDYFPYIIDFANGSLEPEKEEEFFSALSSSEELRTELKSHLAIKQAVKDNLGRFVPPAESTLALFTKLNLSVEGVNPPVVARPPEPGKILSFFSNNRQGLVSGAVAALLTAAAFLFVVIPALKYSPANVINHNSQYLSGESKQEVSKPAVVQTIPQSENFSTLTTSGLKRHVVDFNPVQKSSELASANQDDLEIPGIPVLSPELPVDEHSLASLSGERAKDETLPVEEYKPYYEESGIKLPVKGDENTFSVEISNTPSWFFAGYSENASNNSLFTNMALNVSYYLSKSVALSAEARHESFTVYDRPSTGSQLAGGDEQELLEDFTTFSAGVRFESHNTNLEPFGRFSAGLNARGYVLRTGAGLAYFPYKDLGLDLSVEYSHMFYKNADGRLKNSKKLGINWGVAYYFNL